TETFAVHGTQDPDVNHELAHTLGRNHGQENACIAFSCKDFGADATESLSPTLRAGNSSNSNQNSGQPPAICIQGAVVGRNDNAGPQGKGYQEELAYTQNARTEADIVQCGMQVRRLTPVECERLQGFPDNHTQISWRGKDATDCPDGPRYRAIGNSMAVPVMRWIGERILAALPVQEAANPPKTTQTNEKPESAGIPMSYQLIGGRCEHALKNLPDNSVDAIVTDPPYGIGFMSNKWDYAVPTVEQWAECLRVLKPGGHLLAFGGSRTYHRLVVNIEDAGFEIRDQIMWIYGSGFPKSKNLDGEHKGKGTALKPAHEPIVMARKPLSTTILDNVTEYGTGALNIDLCRVPTEEMLAGGSGGLLSDVRDGKTPAGGEWTQNNEGRWPANVIHDGSDEVIVTFPDAKGQQGKAKNDGSDSGNKVYGELKNVVSNPEPRTESATSAARFFYCAKVSKSDRDAGMDRFVVASASEMTGGRAEGSVGINNPRAGAGRTSGAKNTHPTVKPVDLMRYLCRLVTPAGGTVLDPFMGSGSTGKAAIAEGFRFIGIEMDPDHLVTAAARIGHAVKEMEKAGEAA
uniref:DNA-methyltransferase n=1 Tax=Morganella morganii TaxID=582 RepID=UPI001F053C47